MKYKNDAVREKLKEQIAEAMKTLKPEIGKVDNCDTHDMYYALHDIHAKLTKTWHVYPETLGAKDKNL